MGKETPFQLELFSSTESGANREGKRSVLSSFFHYEKVVLLIIAFLFVGIASFSLGVKKGREFALLTKEKGKDFNAAVEINPVSKIKESSPAEKTKEPEPKASESQEVNYTIQVATYRSHSYADREAERLNKKGLQTFILTKGEYVMLCVGKFLNKNDARTILKDLKNRYQDCFIKRL